MVKIEKAVFDTGPFLHLHEIAALLVLEIIDTKYITDEVKKELEKYAVNVEDVHSVVVKQLSLRYKNIAKIITDAYELSLGEATAIALAQQEQIPLFFTDDLQAREVAQKLHLRVHGTLGLLLRAFRENKITKMEIILFVQKLSRSSTLFITSDLVAWILKEIEEYKPKQ